MLKNLIVISSCMMLLGCSEQLPVAQEPLFDTKLFFTQQIALLKSNPQQLVKKLDFGGQSDSLFLSAPDWPKELADFVAVDLRKPAYAGRFTKDSTLSKEHTIIHYQCNDQSMDIKDVWISQKNDTVIGIICSLEEKNQLYESQKRLKYDVSTGFEISGYQSVRLSKSFSYGVKGSFVSPILNQ